jgi:cellulose biosynthesis protein BcsQ
MKIQLPPVISFYSFKGGAGRTLCTANLVGLLAHEIGATQDAPMVLLDMDLDSAGLTIMLEQADAVGKRSLNMSKIMSGKFSLRGNEKIEQLRQEGMVDISAKVDAPPGSVLFIGAEPVGHKAEPGKASMGDSMVALLEAFFACQVSAVVMDCASGLQPVADLARQLSNLIVYCCRLTGQFLWGTNMELRLFVGSSSPDERPNILILPVAVPDPKNNQDFKNYFSVAMSELRRLDLDLSGRGHEKTFLFESGICEVQLFKWDEKVLSLIEKSDKLAQDEKSALDSFRLLATKVAEMSGLTSVQN